MKLKLKYSKLASVAHFITDPKAPVFKFYNSKLASVAHFITDPKAPIFKFYYAETFRFITLTP